jgi:uncharacterized protein (TIGR03437 family)
MNRVRRLCAGLCVGMGLVGVVAEAAPNGIPRFVNQGSAAAPLRTPTAQQHPAYDFRGLPLYFEQDPGGARFQTRTPESALVFGPGGFRVAFSPAGSSVQVRFQGARKGALPTGQEPRAAFSNYFVGNDPRRWSTRRHYGSVRYDALWSGIDLLFYARQGELEYDFDIAPYADPERIRLRVDGHSAISVDDGGDLWIANRYGKTRQRRPVIYQEIEGSRIPVAGGYRILDHHLVGFWLGPYDPSHKLVIDPVLEFATVLGGRGFDLATAVAVDSSNNFYVAGYTQYADFSTTPAPRRLAANAPVGPNVFLVKLDGKTKQIVYIDFFGGSVYDKPWSMAVDSTGAVTVVGETLSPDIPTVNASIPTATVIGEASPVSGAALTYGFAARIAPDGASLTYSTYTPVGVAYGVALNSAGAAWVVGSTGCYTGFIAPPGSVLIPTAGAQQGVCAQSGVNIDQTGFLIRLGGNGALQYASYFVPAAGSGHSNGISDAAVDPQDNVYVAGTMIGPSDVTRAVFSNGSYQNFTGKNMICEVTKFDSTGHTIWTRTLGGSHDQECLRIGTDSSANVYIAGYTTSQDFPVTAGAFQRAIGSPGQIPNVEKTPLGDVNNRPMYDSFVAGFQTGGQLIYSSYLGGNGDDYAIGIAVTGSGNAFFTGYTNSRNFPVTAGAVQTAYGGGQADAYVTGVSPDGTRLVNSTFFGGSAQDEGYQVAVDKLGNVYLAGGTESADLPVTADALRRVEQGADAMIAKFNLQTCNPTVTLSTPLLPASSATATVNVTTDVPGCAWTLSSTSNWIQFNPSSGNGNQTVSVPVAANTGTQSRLAIINANSRRTFVYQAGQSACELILLPGDMALSSNSERHLLAVQAPDPSCAWTASSNQSWLHILSAASGKGTSTIAIATDQNDTSAPRSAALTVGNRSLKIGQSAGGCVITLSSGALTFSPAGGLGKIDVVASSSQCSWQAKSGTDWVLLPSSSGTNYGNGLVRFSVLPNSAGAVRTGTIVVGGKTANITQNAEYTRLTESTGEFTSSSQTAASAPPSDVARSGIGGARFSMRTMRPRFDLGKCGSGVNVSSPVTLDSSNSFQFTVTRTKSGCGMTAAFVLPDLGFTITPASVPTSQQGTITFRITAPPNQTSKLIRNAFNLVTGDTAVGTVTIEVDQPGAATPLVVPSVKQLLATPSTDAIPISSATGVACTWAVDPSSVPNWIAVTPVDGTGACGSQLQFSYQANGAGSHRRAILKFTSGDQTELDQLAAAPPCQFSFPQTAPLSVSSGGGPVTLDVMTAAGCQWSVSSDSPGWIAFPQGASGTGPGPLTVQVGPNDTTSRRTAQILLDTATAFVMEDAAASLPSCVFTLSPPSRSFPNTGGTFTFQVQTAANCTWQPSQPPADSWLHLQSTAAVTGPGSVTFTVDANSVGAAARTSSISVTPGVNFAISEDAGATPACNYVLAPWTTTFGNIGGTFTFQVQTTSNCAWQPTVPAATWVHLQSTAQVAGPGSVTFAVDANPSGSPERSSSIGVANVTFTFSEAAGGALAPSFTATGVVNAASRVSGSVAPGEIVAISGSNLGPAGSVAGSVVSGKFTTSAGGTQVLFDGVAAPVLFSSADQVIAVVPYAVANKSSTQVQIVCNGLSSPPASIPVVATAPGLFTSSGGTGQGTILNQNLTVNSTQNPAAAGEAVVLYGTGEGQTNPAGVDGLVATSVRPKPLANVTVTIGGLNAEVKYAGAADELVAGIFQVDAVVPAGIEGNQPVVVIVGGKPTAGGVTVAVKQTTSQPSGAITATPNPLNVCSTTAIANVVLSWSTTNVTSIKIFSGSLTGTVVASGGPSGRATVAASTNTTFLLVDTSSGGTPTQANVLATLTLAQGTCTVAPAGTLTATPNPLNVCSATTSASDTLTWQTTNVTAVQIRSGSLAGPVVASGGPAGSVTLTATPNTSYLLVDTSAGGAATAANVLSTVTIQQGTCTTQPGAPPPTTDLAQSVADWVIQYLYNGSPAEGGAADDTSPGDILDGASSMYVVTTNGNHIVLTRNGPAGGWDLSRITNILLAMQSDVTPGYWAAGSPSFRLQSANGSLTLSPTNSSVADASYFGWARLKAPIAGSTAWQAVTSGQFNIQNVTAIRIDLAVSGTGWAVLLNAMFLQ